MRRLLVIHLFLLLPFLAFAQVKKNPYGAFNKDTVIDKARLECIYYYLTSDPKLNESREGYEMVQIGKRYAKSVSYARFQQDSVFTSLNYYTREDLTYKDLEPYFRKYNDPIGLPEIIKDLGNGNLEYQGKIFIDRYIYEEPKLDFGWTLTDDTLTVCGHPCHGATATFRGRVWKAWYADDIAVSSGPWKFSGLSGLILQIEDSKREHVFRAVSVRKGKSNIKKVDYRDFKTNRKWFNKALNEYNTNPQGTIGASGIEVKEIGGNGAPPRPRRGFNNPIEKE